jgi:peroxiredoxin
MLALGTPAPAFRLPDTTEDRSVGLEDFATSPVLLVMFLCNHCPFVIHVKEELARLARDYVARGVAVVAINANDVENYPEDAPEKMTIMARQSGWEFPYLFDADQSVARAYRAACTPDFFVFDRERRLAYRGQLDASRPGNDAPVDGRDLRAALEALLAGRTIAEEDQRPSLGCNIKWKPGHEPDWFG